MRHGKSRIGREVGTYVARPKTRGAVAMARGAQGASRTPSGRGAMG